MKRALASALALSTGLVAVMVASPASAVTAPSAPASCSASVLSDGGFRVGWTRPSNDGGGVIWRYVVKVKGQKDPVIRLDSAKSTDNATRAYNWAHATKGSSPLTFQVRAVNSAGRSAWCEALPGSTSTDPAPAPAPEPAPDPAPAPEPSPSGRPFVAYGESSFLQSELAGAPVDSNLTSSFRSFMKSHPDQNDVPYPSINGVNGNKWGMVYDLGDCSDPVWKIKPTASLGAGANPEQWQSLTTSGAGFHADAGLGSRLTGTSDSPMVVIDTCTGVSLWASNAVAGTGNVITVGSFGAFDHDSNGLDRRNPLSSSSVNERSRGIIPDSMMVRKDLMDYALATGTDLGHALEIFLAETDSSAGHVHPMVGDESGKYGFGAEGTRIAVSPSVNLAGRSCSPEALVLARTLQNYGGYIGDNAGNETTIKAEQETSTHPVWKGTLASNELAGCITWDDFVVIKPGWQ